MSFKREARYVVLKISDIKNAALTAAEQVVLDAVCAKVDQGRAWRGKGPLEGVVVEKDWPEFEPTWAAIEKRCAEVKP